MSTQQVLFLTGPEKVELRRVPIPEPAAMEILVQIGVATTCGTDVKVFQRGGHPTMIKPPAPFGHELAGTVVRAGEEQQEWKVGDRVVVVNSASCGSCHHCARGRENLCTDLRYVNGAFAEYLLVPERFVRQSTYSCPASLPFEVAALAEPLACVLHGIEASDLGDSSDVVLYGSGPIGLLFVNVLSDLGHRVVCVDPHPSRLALAAGLGAAETVPIPRRRARAAEVRKRARVADGFDIAIDATGTPEGWTDAIESVQPGGFVNLFGGCAPGATVPLDAHRLHYSEITVKGVYHHRPQNVLCALELLAAGKIRHDALLSAERPLAEVEAALRAMMNKEALKVVIRPPGP